MNKCSLRYKFAILGLVLTSLCGAFYSVKKVSAATVFKRACSGDFVQGKCKVYEGFNCEGKDISKKNLVTGRGDNKPKLANMGVVYASKEKKSFKIRLKGQFDRIYIMGDWDAETLSPVYEHEISRSVSNPYFNLNNAIYKKNWYSVSSLKFNDENNRYIVVVLEYKENQMAIYIPMDKGTEEIIEDDGSTDDNGAYITGSTDSSAVNADSDKTFIDIDDSTGVLEANGYEDCYIIKEGGEYVLPSRNTLTNGVYIENETTYDEDKKMYTYKMKSYVLTGYEITFSPEATTGNKTITDVWQCISYTLTGFDKVLIKPIFEIDESEGTYYDVNYAFINYDFAGGKLLNRGSTYNVYDRTVDTVSWSAEYGVDEADQTLKFTYLGYGVPSLVPSMYLNTYKYYNSSFGKKNAYNYIIPPAGGYRVMGLLDEDSGEFISLPDKKVEYIRNFTNGDTYSFTMKYDKDVVLDNTVDTDTLNVIYGEKNNISIPVRSGYTFKGYISKFNATDNPELRDYIIAYNNYKNSGEGEAKVNGLKTLLDEDELEYVKTHTETNADMIELPAKDKVWINENGEFNYYPYEDFPDVLSAVWKPIEYQICFIGSTPITAKTSVLSGKMTYINCTYDEKNTLPKNTYVLPGYEFKNWFCPNYVGTVFLDQENFRNLATKDGQTLYFYTIFEAVDSKVKVNYKIRTKYGELSEGNSELMLLSDSEHTENDMVSSINSSFVNNSIVDEAEIKNVYKNTFKSNMLINDNSEESGNTDNSENGEASENSYIIFADGTGYVNVTYERNSYLSGETLYLNNDAGVYLALEEEDLHSLVKSLYIGENLTEASKDALKELISKLMNLNSITSDSDDYVIDDSGERVYLKDGTLLTETERLKAEEEQK
nr:hypothetical protein [Lachnospiraceae bacterium]